MWVPWPSLQVIQNWKGVICRMVALKFRGAWTDWKTVQSWTKGNAPGKNNCVHQHTLWANWLESRFAGSRLGLLVHSRLTISQQHDFAAEKASSILSCIRKCIASSLRQIILPLYSPPEQGYRPGEHCTWRRLWSTYQLTWAGACLFFMCSMAFRPRHAAQTPQPQDELSQLMITEDPQGSFLLDW